MALSKEKTGFAAFGAAVVYLGPNRAILRRQRTNRLSSVRCEIRHIASSVVSLFATTIPPALTFVINSVDLDFDIYNAFNSDAILTETQTYASSTSAGTWRPTALIQGRIFKFGMRWDFQGLKPFR